MRIVSVMLLAASLAGCAVYTAGSAVVSVASTAVTTTADVASSAVCAIACADKHEDEKR